jgi:hypothetical protein
MTSRSPRRRSIKPSDFRRRPSVEQEAASTLEGSLEKKSRGGSWQRRWFVLSSHFLKYYGGQDKQKLKGALDLRDLRNISIGNNSAMLVEFGDDSIYQLRSGDATESAEWLRVLSSFMPVNEEAEQTGQAGKEATEATLDTSTTSETEQDTSSQGLSTEFQLAKDALVIYTDSSGGRHSAKILKVHIAHCKRFP